MILHIEEKQKFHLCLKEEKPTLNLKLDFKGMVSFDFQQLKKIQNKKSSKF